MAVQIVPLGKTHKVNDFDCGDAELNSYLRTIARQHQRKLISKTYVLVDEKTPDAIIGFYTVALRKMIPTERLPPAMAKRLPPEVPGYSLARLAVNQQSKGRGHGEYLLLHALKRIARVAAEVGGIAAFVDAKDEQATAFYIKYGFIQLPDAPLTLYLPFMTISA